MSIKTTGVWIVSVIAAGALGWYAAMEVNRGPAFTSEQDAYERFSNAFTITDTLERIEVVDRLVRRLTPETLPGAVRALEDDLLDVPNHDLKMVLWYWARHDPRAMLQEMQAWPEVRAQRMAAGEAVYWVLKREGYDAAHELLDQMPHHQRDQALSHMVLAYLDSGETPNLVSLIDSYQKKSERDLAAGIVVGRMLKTDGPEALARWVESLPDGPISSMDLKVVSFEAAQSELMRRDQFEFLEGWFDRVEGQRWAKSGGRRSVGIHLAKRDPMRAIAYAESLPPEKDRDEVLNATLRTFATHDRLGALEWMRGRKPDKSLDKGTARLVYEFVERSPEAALEMLGRIQDPKVFAQAEKLANFHWKSLAADLRVKMFKRLAELPRPADASPASGAGAASSPAADERSGS